MSLDILRMYDTSLIMYSLLSCTGGLVVFFTIRWIKKNWWPKKLCEIADEGYIDYAVDYAESKSKKALALDLLRRVRTEHGHDSVRLGHTIWIQDVVDGSSPIPEDGSTPSFGTIEDANRHLANPNA
ncbi:MAG: hypothetical protein EOO52_13270 [Gammaproteobacteria bacterium]|nr:MAG: hypothetical protein EOO52_13270 [Gammaproteobacteria bacterium]